MTNRVTLAVDLDLDREGVQAWIRNLATIMASDPNLIEPVVDSNVLDVQQIPNPARVSMVDVMEGGSELRGPFIAHTDKETGEEFVSTIEERKELEP